VAQRAHAAKHLVAGVGRRDALVRRVGECEGEVDCDRLPRLAAQTGRMHEGSQGEEISDQKWGRRSRWCMHEGSQGEEISDREWGEEITVVHARGELGREARACFTREMWTPTLVS
jgi:hypothetical protein